MKDILKIIGIAVLGIGLLTGGLFLKYGVKKRTENRIQSKVEMTMENRFQQLEERIKNLEDKVLND